MTDGVVVVGVTGMTVVGIRVVVGTTMTVERLGVLIVEEYVVGMMTVLGGIVRVVTEG